MKINVKNNLPDDVEVQMVETSDGLVLLSFLRPKSEFLAMQSRVRLLKLEIGNT